MDGKRPGDENEKSPPEPCGNVNCGETDQINWLQVGRKTQEGEKATNLP
jgi:hypothetical protein